MIVSITQTSLKEISGTQIKTHGSESRGQEEAAVRDERVIKTHGSESRGQEAAVRDERVSYLHVALL